MRARLSIEDLSDAAILPFASTNATDSQNWKVVFAGVTFAAMDWINEIWNSLVFHFTGFAPVWGAPAGTAYLVLVGLKTPWSPEGPLSKEMVVAQREAIAAAQNYLLTELANTEYRITRRYRVIPGIALEVGLDALKVLARSVAVTNVLRDRAAISAK